MNLVDELLMQLVKRNGSDLHLIAGDPPRIRLISFDGGHLEEREVDAGADAGGGQDGALVDDLGLDHVDGRELGSQMRQGRGVRRGASSRPRTRASSSSAACLLVAVISGRMQLWSNRSMIFIHGGSYPSSGSARAKPPSVRR